jgi:hypothetical protein
VIACPGIFLLKKRTVGKSFSLEKLIPFIDLLLVRLDGQDMDFHGPMVTIFLHSPKSEQIVSMVWNIRMGLFSEKPRSAKLALADPASKPRIEAGWSFASTSLFVDRFLSASLAVSPSVYIPDEVTAMCDALEKSRSTFRLSPEILLPHLPRPICSALSCSTEIQSLEIRNLNLPDLLPNFLLIVRHNSSIKAISFHGCAFNGSLKPYFDVWSTKTDFAVNDWIFSDCDLSSDDFILFLHAFEYYPADVSKLAFIDCKMNSKTLETICDRIFICPCFRTVT